MPLSPPLRRWPRGWPLARPPELPALAARPIAPQGAAGCVEAAVRAACGEESVRRLYRLSDSDIACRSDLAVCRARLEEERTTLPFVLEEQLAAGAAREVALRRELTECRAVDRPQAVPWWVWPAVGLAGAAAGAAAWEAVRQ